MTTTNNDCPPPPDTSLAGPDRLLHSIYDPQWMFDSMDVTGKYIAVYEWKPENKKWHPLHLTISTNDGSIVSDPIERWKKTTVPVNMKQVKDRVGLLCVKGGPCGFGVIEPMPAGSHHLITMQDDPQGPFTFLAVISKT